ncbi:MAG TPA: alpha/beta hydrolase [Hellea balneolensis]|uniref:Alpha/beta hydrolase n=1 Tax=Hellea balneolensis TaxID=287478 RepID=A0A7C3C5Q8_9PROT|nr:alpha/beta hydrolase [Hellea balneolensis]
MAREKFTFTGSLGNSLSGKLNWPDEGEVRAWVLFAHGFSVGKDLRPIRTIAKTLVRHGFGMMRFDFTGLGESDGDFSATNFSTNVQDILAAAHYLRQYQQAPGILVGHSFGGTAALMAAHDIPECKALATIGSPCDTNHILHQFANKIEEIEEEGEARVLLAGRPFVIKEQFLDDVANQDMSKAIAGLNKALMVFHSPQDHVVGIQNASHIYSEARHPKSFVSLDGADHLLLKNPEDARYVARVLSAWAARYI